MTAPAAHGLAVFNVRHYGATGRKEADAQPALQAALDACGAAGGGMVYLPPGAYTSGTLYLRSRVRLHLEAGATLYSSKDTAAFTKNALLYAEDVENITLEGRGTVDGQAAYLWRLADFRDMNIYPNQVAAEQAGVPLNRAFPTADSVGHLVLFLRCQDVRISNCTIDTGDDALVFYSSNIYGPPQPCENITVTNCRLSSSSSALKFCDVNYNAIRNVTITNCVITDSNRGIAFMVWDGGVVEDVVIANVTVECRRHHWFWWGDGDPLHFNLTTRGQIDPELDSSKLPPIGALRNVRITNLIAHGPGPSRIQGDPTAVVENVTLENVRLTIDSDVASPWKKKPVALTIKHARNFTLRDAEITWQAPGQDHWTSALLVHAVAELTLDNISARQGLSQPAAPAVVLRDVEGAVVQNSQAQPGTGTFLQLEGAATRDIVLWANDLRAAATPVDSTPEVPELAVRNGWA